MIADDRLNYSFCLRNECLNNVADYYSAPIAIFGFFVDVLVLVATVGGILVALMSYLGSKDTSNFTNHISHLSLFQEFFVGEVNKRDRLSISSFDVYRVYFMVFPGSKDGDFVPGEDYSYFLTEVNNAINESNRKFTSGSIPPFSYQQHQTAMIDCFRMIGLSLQHVPKLDFFEIENQVLDLLETINKSFIGGHESLKVNERLYR
ncbi:hypothetical protein CQ007_12540 [Pseudomonas sp. MYb185]|nr:hypothetical protein CQ007_12540 [Pseudomonas sp. MYb185]